jgi:hypothetical protein
MTEYSQQKILNVFLASPSNLTDERRITKRCVDLLNKRIGSRLGWHVDLLGWEDTLPGYVRPQDKINLDVDRCHLFVGLLWRRWGEPPGGGTWTSGFQEEFERARERREAAGSPEIWLFFRQVEEALRIDPGEQLQNVISFKEQIRLGKKIFYKEFNDASEWTQLFEDYLYQHVLDLYNPSQSVDATETATKTPSIHPIAQIADNRAAESVISGQDDGTVAKLLAEITDSVRSGVLSVYEDNATAITKLSFEQVARFSVLAGALFSDRYTDEFCRPHEANILLKDRKTTVLSARERRFLFRSTLANTGWNVPGWFAIRNISGESLFNHLLWLALNDESSDVRSGVLSLLRFLQYHRFAALSNETSFFAAILRDHHKDSAEAAFEYIGSVGSLDAIGVLKQRMLSEPDNRDNSNSSVRKNIEAAIYKILLREDPNRLLTELSDTQPDIPYWLASELQGHASQFKPDALVCGLTNKDATIRAFCARQLDNRGLLDRDQAKMLISDNDQRVRYVGCLWLVEHDEHDISEDKIRELLRASQAVNSLLSLLPSSNSSPDEIIARLYSGLSYDEISQKIDWYSINGEIAYRIRGIRFFSRVGDQIRKDIDDNFVSFKERSDRKLDERYATLGGKSVVLATWKESTDEFVREKFMGSAFAVVGEHGDVRDLPRVRMYLDNHPERGMEPMVAIVRRFGDESDVKRLITVAERTYGATRSHYIEAIVQLTGDPGNIVKENDLDPDLRREISLRMSRDAILHARPLWLPMLLHRDTGLRRAMLLQVLKYASRAALHRLLDRYLKQETYFYDVAFWLDRVCHSPIEFQRGISDSLDATLRR